MLVSGSLDARTPISNAQEVLRGLVKGQHLILEGVSHDFALGDEQNQKCLETVIQFLKGGSISITEITEPFKFDPIIQK